MKNHRREFLKLGAAAGTLGLIHPTPAVADQTKDQANALAVILKEEFGVDFHFFDAITGNPIASADPAPGGHGDTVRESSTAAPWMLASSIWRRASR